MSSLVIAAALGSGLVAGIWFTFSNFVMPALAGLPAAQGLAAMQSINVRVLNPVFFGAFFGTGGASVLVVWLALSHWGSPGAPPAVAGAALYLVGSIGVTMVGNVPLNQALERLDPHAPDAEGRWRDYVARWTRWNHVRAVGTAAAAFAFLLALA
jgi:uncharacterized membrane protein